MPAKISEPRLLQKIRSESEIEHVECKLFPFFVRFSWEKAWNLIQMKLVITECTAKRAFSNEFTWAFASSFQQMPFIFIKFHHNMHMARRLCADRMHIRWHGFQFVKIKCDDFFFSFAPLCRWTNERMSVFEVDHKDSVNTFISICKFSM